MNIIARVDDLRNDIVFPKDVVVVEHDERAGVPARISVMLYGTGLSVITLEKTDMWRVSHISDDTHYRNAAWPKNDAAPTVDGALNLIAGLIEYVVEHDRV